MVFFSDVILGGLELIVVNAYHSPGAIGKMDIAKNQWNANVTTGTMETFANMRFANQDVTSNMATVYIPILAGVIQVFYSIITQSWFEILNAILIFSLLQTLIHFFN